MDMRIGALYILRILAQRNRKAAAQLKSPSALRALLNQLHLVHDYDVQLAIVNLVDLLTEGDVLALRSASHGMGPAPLGVTPGDALIGGGATACMMQPPSCWASSASSVC